MERYIEKINKKLEEKDEKHAKRIKNIILAVGGTVLAVGLAGFLASFVTFMVLFFKFKTDDAFVAWIVAVPFLVLLIAGAVVTRIGDALKHKTSQSASEPVKENAEIEEKTQDTSTQNKEKTNGKNKKGK